MLKNLTQAVLYLSRQELAFRGHDESNDSLNRGNYMELLERFAKMDSVFERQLHGTLVESSLRGAGRFTGVSPDIQNDLIKRRFFCMLRNTRSKLMRIIYRLRL